MQLLGKWREIDKSPFSPMEPQGDPHSFHGQSVTGVKEYGELFKDLTNETEKERKRKGNKDREKEKR
jgi:hypothetical protein